MLPSHVLTRSLLHTRILTHSLSHILSHTLTLTHSRQMLPSHVLTRGEVQLLRDHFCGNKEHM